MERRSNVQKSAIRIGRAGKTEVLQSKTNVNVLNKTLKRLQVRKIILTLQPKITRLLSREHG